MSTKSYLLNYTTLCWSFARSTILFGYGRNRRKPHARLAFFALFASAWLLLACLQRHRSTSRYCFLASLKACETLNNQDRVSTLLSFVEELDMVLKAEDELVCDTCILFKLSSLIYCSIACSSFFLLPSFSSLSMLLSFISFSKRSLSLVF